MGLRQFLVVLVVLLSSTAWANNEHRACLDNDYAYTELQADEIRAIAITCQSSPTSALYYKRAYHMDLVVEATTLSMLTHASGRESTPGFYAYQLYMALIEQFSRLWFTDLSKRIAFLNNEYEIRGEIASLRLRGHDHMANALEKSLF